MKFNQFPKAVCESSNQNFGILPKLKKTDVYRTNTFLFEGLEKERFKKKLNKLQSLKTDLYDFDIFTEI